MELWGLKSGWILISVFGLIRIKGFKMRITNNHVFELHILPKTCKKKWKITYYAFNYLYGVTVFYNLCSLAVNIYQFKIINRNTKKVRNMFKVNNNDTRGMSVFIANFELIWHLVFLFLTMNRYMFAGPVQGSCEYHIWFTSHGNISLLIRHLIKFLFRFWTYVLGLHRVVNGKLGYKVLRKLFVEEFLFKRDFWILI